jgi:hypothetical protein
MPARRNARLASTTLIATTAHSTAASSSWLSPRKIMTIRGANSR